jgi:DtxR family Mn-dependent transcriptional regulator
MLCSVSVLQDGMRNVGWVLAILLVGLAATAWPRYGVVARRRRARALARRSRCEDALKHVLKCEADRRTASFESVAGAVGVSTGAAARLLADLAQRGLLAFEDGMPRLTPLGRDLALHIVRAHRLWESYLADQTGVAEREWHHRADVKEHLLTPREADALAARLGHPMHDPHGDAIPDSDGTLEGERGRSLSGADLDAPVLITHIEDEPETVYRQLLAEGLRPGMRAFVIERSASRVRFWAGGKEHVLPPVSAENVSVRPLPDSSVEDLVEERFLAALQPGGKARVVGISAACRGPDRRRLLDLGFVPGTVVEVDMVSPAGDPTAFRVRGTVVALRREQASQIRVEPAR